MSIEKPEKPKMRIVHSREDKRPNEEFDGLYEITPEFLKQISFDDKALEAHKTQILRVIDNEKDPKIKKELWDNLVSYLKDSTED